MLQEIADYLAAAHLLDYLLQFSHSL